jgi:uncharacterized protein YbbK (DUF523 family)
MKSDVRSDPEEIRIGVSACLPGEKVRYNGGHKKEISWAARVALSESER